MRQSYDLKHCVDVVLRFIHRKRWRIGSLADSCSCCCPVSFDFISDTHHCKVAAKNTRKENGQTRSEM